MLEHSACTISRELARNRGRRGYRPKQAHKLSISWQAMNARTIDDATWHFAQEKLLEQWSPDQISAHLRAAGQGCISGVSTHLCGQADGWITVEESALP
jgi:IS30 family transposase